MEDEGARPLRGVRHPVGAGKRQHCIRGGRLERGIRQPGLFRRHPLHLLLLPWKIFALDTKTGAIKWATYTLPDDEGYSGAPIWGSRAIDKQRGAVYITTGNNYSLPAAKITCVDEATTFEAKQACLAGDNFDAIMSLNMTGADQLVLPRARLGRLEYRLRSAGIQRGRHQPRQLSGERRA